MKQVKTKKAPNPVGPYSQGVLAGNFLFCSGQIGINPKTNQMVKGGIEKETKQAMKNLSSVLTQAGLSFDNVVRTDIFLSDMNDFSKVNDVYASFFAKNPKPARQTVAVNLPRNAKIEISCVAYKK